MLSAQASRVVVLGGAEAFWETSWAFPLTVGPATQDSLGVFVLGVLTRIFLPTAPGAVLSGS